MAARWQQWMPFHIDRFRGSPDVQAMHPAARAGFLYLLASAWQTDDCTLSSDPIDLATASGLGDELWAVYGGRILRKFQAVDGRLINSVLLAEWLDSKAVYDKRRSGAVRTNEARSPDAVRTQSERNTDTVTGTETVTTTETKKRETPTRGKRVEPDFIPPGWIDPEAWSGYLEVRRKKRAVMSSRALAGVVDRLSGFRAKGHDANEILATSLRSNWIDVYEPKGRSNGASLRAANPSADREAANKAAIEAGFSDVIPDYGADEERSSGVHVILPHRGPSRDEEIASGETSRRVWPQLITGRVS